MGLFDQVLGAASGATQQHTGLAAMVVDLLSGAGGGGGLQGLVKTFGEQGLSHVMASWIGTGQNLPIDPGQVNQVLGGEQVQAMAAKVGISPEAASSMLSKLLPTLVDQATPAGQIPEEGALQQGLGVLRKTFGS